MSGDEATILSPFGRVRRAYWFVLAAALLLALAVPAATLWHTASSELRLRAYVWPAVPHVGEPVQVLVMPLNDADGTATEGSWARLVVHWDMVDMRMSTHPISVPGHSDGSTFAVPLQVDMAGLWQADVALQTPGRPSWHTSLRVVVLPSTPSTTSTTPTTTWTTSADTATDTATASPAAYRTRSFDGGDGAADTGRQST